MNNENEKTRDLVEIAFEASRTTRPNFVSLKLKDLGARQIERYFLETQAVATAARGPLPVVMREMEDKLLRIQGITICEIDDETLVENRCYELAEEALASYTKLMEEMK